MKTEVTGSVEEEKTKGMPWVHIYCAECVETAKASGLDKLPAMCGLRVGMPQGLVVTDEMLDTPETCVICADLTWKNCQVCGAGPN